MTPEQKAAFVNAQVELMRVESQVMQTENILRERAGFAPANGPDEWRAFLQRWDSLIGYNALIAFFS